MNGNRGLGKIVFFSSLLAATTFASSALPKLKCLNHNHRVSLDEQERGLVLLVSSERRSSPLLPMIDPRIGTVEVGPMPCAQTLGGATVCYTNVCRFERYFDFDGKELTDIKPSGEILLTALPEWRRDKVKRSHTRYLKVHFEINDLGEKGSVDESFETFPGKYCDLSDQH